MAEDKLRELAAHLHVKALELSARAQLVADHPDADTEEAFVIVMLRESERAVIFWVDQLIRESLK